MLHSKLQDAEKNFLAASETKKELEGKLHSISSNLDEALRRFQEANYEKNNELEGLLGKLKDLHDKINLEDQKQARTENKNQEVLSTITRTNNENNHVIDKLKTEAEKLSDDNIKLIGRVSKLSQDCEGANVEFDKQQ